MPLRAQMSLSMGLIMGQINLKIRSYLPLNLKKLLNLTCVHTSIYKYLPNLVEMYVTIRSQMSSIMYLIGQELCELSALDLENLPYLTLLTL